MIQDMFGDIFSDAEGMHTIPDAALHPFLGSLTSPLLRLPLARSGAMELQQAIANEIGNPGYILRKRNQADIAADLQATLFPEENPRKQQRPIPPTRAPPTARHGDQPEYDPATEASIDGFPKATRPSNACTVAPPVFEGFKTAKGNSIAGPSEAALRAARARLFGDEEGTAGKDGGEAGAGPPVFEGFKTAKGNSIAGPSEAALRAARARLFGDEEERKEEQSELNTEDSRTPVLRKQHFVSPLLHPSTRQAASYVPRPASEPGAIKRRKFVTPLAGPRKNLAFSSPLGNFRAREKEASPIRQVHMPVR